METKPKIVLADDHPAILEEVSRLLRAEFDVVATVHDGSSAVQAVVNLNPEAIVLDIAMPGLDGIDAARQLRKMGYMSRVVFLTVYRDPDYLEIAAEMDASYVLKSRMRSDLPIAIRQALAGRQFVSPFSHSVDSR